MEEAQIIGSIMQHAKNGFETTLEIILACKKVIFFQNVSKINGHCIVIKKKWVQNMHFANYGDKNFKTLFSNTKFLSNQTFRNTFPKIWGKNKTYFPYQNSLISS